MKAKRWRGIYVVLIVIDLCELLSSEEKNVPSLLYNGFIHFYLSVAMQVNTDIETRILHTHGY